MKDVENSSKARQGSKTKEAEHLISRCQNFAHPKTKVRNPWAKGSNFRTPQFQGAKPIPRCEIRFQGANFLNTIFAHHCSRCEISFWHTSAIFAHLKPIFAPCKTRCENFAHLISRCENFAHLISRCEFLSPRGGIFAHPNSRCEILSPRCENFAR